MLFSSHCLLTTFYLVFSILVSGTKISIFHSKMDLRWGGVYVYELLSAILDERDFLIDFVRKNVEIWFLATNLDGTTKRNIHSSKSTVDMILFHAKHLFSFFSHSDFANQLITQWITKQFLIAVWSIKKLLEKKLIVFFYFIHGLFLFLISIVVFSFVVDLLFFFATSRWNDLCIMHTTYHAYNFLDVQYSCIVYAMQKLPETIFLFITQKSFSHSGA